MLILLRYVVIVNTCAPWQSGRDAGMPGRTLGVPLWEEEALFPPILHWQPRQQLDLRRPVRIPETVWEGGRQGQEKGGSWAGLIGLVDHSVDERGASFQFKPNSHSDGGGRGLR